MKKIFISKEKIEEAIRNNNYRKDAAKLLGIDVGTFMKIVKSYNLVYPRVGSNRGKQQPNNTCPFVTKEWLEKEWINTSKSLSLLSKQFNIPEKRLQARASRYGISKKYLYKVNVNKFFDINDVNVWYLAGLAATDGYLPKNKNCLQISLTGESELTLLLDIKNYFEIESPITRRKNETTHCLRIALDGLNSFYTSNFNINDGAKTFVVGVPNKFPTEEHAKAFVRGCFDGDGSIRKNSKKCSILTASENFMSGLCSIINTYLPLQIKLNRTRKYPSINVGGKNCIILLNWMYSVDNCFKLERKYNRYKLMILSKL